jgi:phosphatidylglycerol:prolipoprotein diacylglycerol transferase
MLAAIQFPTWLKPEIIPGLPFRWYGLMYVVAFLVTWLLFSYESKRRAAPWNEDESAGFFGWAIVGLLVGARLFGTLVYDPSGYYWHNPLYIVWPFDASGRFVGYQGLSFHGGFLGLIVATLVYARVKKFSWFEWADIIAVSAPLGYTAGRLGNFINGELWGKITTKPWGMIFPGAERFAAKETWVQEIAAKTGVSVASMNDLVNLPRHPSQLYEALFEGLALWLVMWLLIRKRPSFKGFATGCYAIGYGAVRFVIEYFREPDAGMGYILPWGNPDAPTYMYTTPFNFSMGQILSFGMILIGVGILVFGKRAARLAEERASAEAAVKARVKSSSKKLNKKHK